ncbi:TIGR00296 family protein [Candidatus Woesearchaeota archaeon]|nr:TIGR00296 family protein [Candidatus Woesearchaeota archaeon]
MFTLKQGRKLVKLARNSIETAFTKDKIDLDDYDNFSEKQGVFVTLNKDSQLRGCIGFTEPIYELKRAIVEAARSAAFSDPRFPSLERDELDSITVEISVLTVPELIEVDDPEEYKDRIIIGSDGLVIKGSLGSGLLLPQVPVEWGWDEEEFLRNICMKAGLPDDAWKDSSTRLYKFQAQIFAEREPQGEIIEKEL